MLLRVIKSAKRKRNVAKSKKKSRHFYSSSVYQKLFEFSTILSRKEITIAPLQKKNT
jgi:hypothetical protein